MFVYDCGEQCTVLLHLVRLQVGEYILVTAHHHTEKGFVFETVICATCGLKPQSSGSVPKILYHDQFSLPRCLSTILVPFIYFGLSCRMVLN